jgi:hypothetical protein
VREPRKYAMAAMRPQKCEEIGIKGKRVISKTRRVRLVYEIIKITKNNKKQ